MTLCSLIDLFMDGWPIVYLLLMSFVILFGRKKKPSLFNSTAIAIYI